MWDRATTSPNQSYGGHSTPLCPVRPPAVLRRRYHPRYRHQLRDRDLSCSIATCSARHLPATPRVGRPPPARRAAWPPSVRPAGMLIGGRLVHTEEAPEKENFHVRLQIDVLEQAFGPRMAGAPSLAQPSRCNGIPSQNSSVNARQRGGSTSVGTGSRVPLEVKPDAYNSGVDEEKLYSDVIQNLQRAPRAKNQDEADNAVRVDDDVVGEDEDLEAVEWDPLNPHMEEDIV
ncbi:hypothetical protein ZWY2020_042791 [Hordeum vulgare]|nr:hypothetical protein ZWY2020_042791 [Hordeum vulgare]